MFHLNLPRYVNLFFKFGKLRTNFGILISWLLIFGQTFTWRHGHGRHSQHQWWSTRTPWWRRKWRSTAAPQWKRNRHRKLLHVHPSFFLPLFFFSFCSCTFILDLLKIIVPFKFLFDGHFAVLMSWQIWFIYQIDFAIAAVKLDAYKA